MSSSFDDIIETVRGYVPFATRVRDAYQEVFGTPQGRRVLRDLYYNCHAGRSTLVLDHDGRVDPIRSASCEGRRWVWLRIQRQLYMSDEGVRQVIESDEARALSEGGEE